MHWNLVGCRPQKSQEKDEDAEEGKEKVEEEDPSGGRCSTVRGIYLADDMIIIGTNRD